MGAPKYKENNMRYHFSRHQIDQYLELCFCTLDKSLVPAFHMEYIPDFKQVCYRRFEAKTKGVFFKTFCIKKESRVFLIFFMVWSRFVFAWNGFMMNWYKKETMPMSQPLGQKIKKIKLLHVLERKGEIKVLLPILAQGRIYSHFLHWRG